MDWAIRSLVDWLGLDDCEPYSSLVLTSGSGHVKGQVFRNITNSLQYYYTIIFQFNRFVFGFLLMGFSATILAIGSLFLGLAAIYVAYFFPIFNALCSLDTIAAEARQ